MSYQSEVDNKNLDKLSELKKQLPFFCTQFFSERRKLIVSTKVAYARDFLRFFTYGQTYIECMKNKVIPDLPIEILDQITRDDMHMYINYLTENNNRSTKESGIQQISVERHLSSLSSLYTWAIKQEKISHHPLKSIERVKVKRKPVVFLDTDEQISLENTIKYGTNLGKRQKKYADFNYERDYAMYLLMIDTGIRVSELVGIDIDHLDLKRCNVYIFRKGHKEQEIYFGDETKCAIEDYLLVRQSKYQPLKDNDALFLTSYGRITIRTVERTISKYVKATFASKQGISPHKMRSSFATSYLEELGDLNSLQKIMGHENIQTTSYYLGDTKKQAVTRNLLEKARKERRNNN